MPGSFTMPTATGKKITRTASNSGQAIPDRHVHGRPLEERGMVEEYLSLGQPRVAVAAGAVEQLGRRQAAIYKQPRGWLDARKTEAREPAPLA